jgi:hypothetical protein
MAVPRFVLGQLVATSVALALLADAGENPAELLIRYQAGDWGEVPLEDACENELSALMDFRILSCYQVMECGERVWIITEANCFSTRILLPEEC